MLTKRLPCSSCCHPCFSYSLSSPLCRLLLQICPCFNVNFAAPPVNESTQVPTRSDPSLCYCFLCVGCLSSVAVCAQQQHANPRPQRSITQCELILIPQLTAPLLPLHPLYPLHSSKLHPCRRYVTSLTPPLNCICCCCPASAIPLSPLPVPRCCVCLSCYRWPLPALHNR